MIFLRFFFAACCGVKFFGVFLGLPFAGGCCLRSGLVFARCCPSTACRLGWPDGLACPAPSALCGPAGLVCPAGLGWPDGLVCPLGRGPPAALCGPSTACRLGWPDGLACPLVRTAPSALCGPAGLACPDGLGWPPARGVPSALCGLLGLGCRSPVGILLILLFLLLSFSCILSTLL